MNDLTENFLELFEDVCISVGRRTGWKLQSAAQMAVWVCMLSKLRRRR